MKKNFYIISVLSIYLALMLTTACSSQKDEPVDNPDKENPNTPAENPEDDKQYNPGDAILKINGKRLTSIDIYDIEYEKSFVKKIYYDNDYYYMKILIDFPEGNYRIDPHNGNDFDGNLSFNERGYVSHLDRYRDYTNSGNTFWSYHTDSISYDYFYDERGYMKEFNINSRYETISSSGSHSLKYINEKATLIWEDGNLMKVDIKSTSVNEEDEIEEYESYFIVSYSNEENKFRQFPLYVTQEVLFLKYPLNILAAIGCFGIGTANLPFDIWRVDRNGERREYCRDYQFILNDNGSIKNEIIDSYNYYQIERYRYEYSSINPGLFL